ncbi:MAG: phage portal protein [Planctomycetia bacterium]|nr:phage portal protein [Planctomycetia bacterium]
MAKKQRSKGESPTFQKKADSLAVANKTLARENIALRRSFALHYDAAQTHVHNQNHWMRSDYLSPDLASSPEIRRVLMRRARHELTENNPYLVGTIDTICDDFAGHGVRINVEDNRLSYEIKRKIEDRWEEWGKAVKLRKILWTGCRMKIVDGETFALLVHNSQLLHPVQLDLRFVEAECIANPMGNDPNERIFDGIKYDNVDNEIAFYVLNNHPGGDVFAAINSRILRDGRWVGSENIVHWFETKRPWKRSPTELAASLPLCAVLRRYTMAELRKQENNACHTMVLESERPSFGASVGMAETDEPQMETFPIEPGVLTALPWGMHAKEFGKIPTGQEYDAFVGSVLREIMRPIGVPYNIAVGTSRDSNMASAVVDIYLYKSKQYTRRLSCEEDFLAKVFNAWFQMGVVTPGYFCDSGFLSDEYFENPPKIKYYWKRIGLEHTDPAKVVNAMVTARDAGLLLDEDIQQEYYNRDYEIWKEKVARECEFRQSLKMSPENDPADENDEKEKKEENEENEEEEEDE